jgi:sugar phosphate permease
VLLFLHSTTPVTAILAVGAVLGLPNAFNNLGLQAALYEATPADHMGAAGGLFQTARYVGAILSTSVLGLVFSTTVTSGGLHLIAVVLAVISGLLLVASMATRRHPRA